MCCHRCRLPRRRPPPLSVSKFLTFAIRCQWENGVVSKLRKSSRARHLTFEPLRSQQRSLRIGKSRRVTKVENKIVAAPTRVGFPVDFESMVRRITHDSLIGPGGRENILVLRERE